MVYIHTRDSKISAIYESLDEDFLATLSEENAEALRSAFEKNIEGAIPFEALPDGFDWNHIARYSIDENHNMIDNGWEEPPKEPTAEELLLETAGDHEYRLCLMELGVTENDLQAL